MDDYLYVFILIKKFLFSVNAYLYIPMVLFLWLKIAINFQKWVYRGIIDIFLLEMLGRYPRSLHYTLLRKCRPVLDKVLTTTK